MTEATLKSRFAAEGEPVGAEVFKAGALAGILGGALMAVWGMFSTLAHGLGPFAVPQLIGASFRGPEALLQGPATILIGVAIHLVTSAFFGVLFATLVRRDTPNVVATLAGVAFALGLFVLMMFVVVPVVDPAMSNRVSMMIGTMLVMHLLYGVGLGLAPTLRRMFAHRAPAQLAPTRVTISSR